MIYGTSVAMATEAQGSESISSINRTVSFGSNVFFCPVLPSSIEFPRLTLISFRVSLDSIGLTIETKWFIDGLDRVGDRGRK